MNAFISRIGFFISASAAILLNVSNRTGTALLACGIVLLLLGLLLARSEDKLFSIKSISLPNNLYATVALLISSGMGVNFYNTWLSSDCINTIATVLGVSSYHFILFLSILGVIAATPAISILLSDSSKWVMEEYQKCPVRLENGKNGLSLKKSFATMAGIYLLGISAILRANFNYIDDMGRVLQGYTGWNNFSRFASNSIATLMHMSDALTDISPPNAVLGSIAVGLVRCHLALFHL